jgi:hypothetical protein
VRHWNFSKLKMHTANDTIMGFKVTFNPTRGLRKGSPAAQGIGAKNPSLLFYGCICFSGNASKP